MSSRMTGCFTHFFQVHDLQSLEQLLLSLEITLEGIHEHRLIEATWAVQVIILFPLVGKIPNDVGLVNIQIIILSYSLEGLYVYGKSSFARSCHHIPCF